VKGITPKLNPRVRTLGKSSAGKKNEIRIRKFRMTDDFKTADEILEAKIKFANITGTEPKFVYLGDIQSYGVNFKCWSIVLKELNLDRRFDSRVEHDYILGMRVVPVNIKDHIAVS
jgi:hypothetical protein